MDWKIVLAIIGSALIGILVFITAVLPNFQPQNVEKRSYESEAYEPVIYRLVFRGNTSKIPGIKPVQDGKEIPFWIESVSKEKAILWIRPLKKGGIRFLAESRRFLGDGEKVFPVFEDFSRAYLKYWKVVNENPMEFSPKKVERMPERRRCLELKVKDGKLIVENGKPFGRCKLMFLKDLKRITFVKLRTTGKFEIGFEGEKGSKLIISGDRKEWKVSVVVGRKALESARVKIKNDWTILEISRGWLKVGEKRLDLHGFTPKKFFLSVGIPGRVEVDYLFSLNSYKEATIVR